MDRNHVYRNQASTSQKIQMIATLRITTREEAIAFLRAIGDIQVQCANIMQKDSLLLQSIRNRQAPKVEKEPVVEPKEDPAEPTPIDLTEEEQHSEKDVAERLKQLRKAEKKTKKDK